MKINAPWLTTYVLSGAIGKKILPTPKIFTSLLQGILQ
jgi:hypothetical protein